MTLKISQARFSKSRDERNQNIGDEDDGAERHLPHDGAETAVDQQACDAHLQDGGGAQGAQGGGARVREDQDRSYLILR